MNLIPVLIRCTSYIHGLFMLVPAPAQTGWSETDREPSLFGPWILLSLCARRLRTRTSIRQIHLNERGGQYTWSNRGSTCRRVTPVEEGSIEGNTGEIIDRNCEVLLPTLTRRREKGL